MKTGWINVDKNWYYMNGSGSMARGMINVNNVSYYLDESGKMLSNTTVNVNGTDYRIDASGAMSQIVPEITATPETSTATVSTQASVGPAGN